MRVLVPTGVICLIAAPAAFIATSGQALEANVVHGVVHDVNGAPMAGVSVNLLRDGRLVATVNTDSRGEFRFEDIAEGIYEVRAVFEGLAPASVHAVVSDLPAPPLRLSLGIQVPSVRQDASAKALGGVAGGVGAGVGGGLAAAAPNAATAETVSGSGRKARMYAPPGDFNTATYDRIDDNRFRRVSDEPLSTFSIDVDTASYSNVRRFLNEGTLPPADAVRVEELINYFSFGYVDPRGAEPFSVTTEVAECPWNPRHMLALVGLQARRDVQEEKRPRNLVFLLDVSGSMTPPDKLPLVRTGMRMLVDTLRPEDRVAIVVYAGASGLVLPSTPGDRKAEIHRAIAELEAGGSTNGAAGIHLAYDTAAASFIKGGVNRVILATDGDFNVGVTSQGELIRLIERQRARGIFLSVLGVGSNNLKDSTMEKLADKGNGNYSYLDSLHEARRVLVAQAGGTLVTVAKDVKIQVEFNPRAVGAYRLVGYENRLLANEDFNDDRKDAGEIGAGHSVTALYELIPPGEPMDAGTVEPLKYQEPAQPTSASHAGELMTVKLRYKQPDGDTSRPIGVAVRDRVGPLTPSIGFAAAVAQFGMLLRDSEFKGASSWASARALARQHRGEDPDGYRGEFVRLVDLAAALQSQKGPAEQTRR